MRMARWGLAWVGGALFVLSACGNPDREPRLMNLRSTTNGPDEFAILPPKALQLPSDLAALPEPTPGAANLSDQSPMADAIVALGGRVPASAVAPASDAGLINYAARQGVAGDIRASLAAEDLRYRQQNRGRPLERLFGVNTYYAAYFRFWLDANAELAKWRAAGAATPSAPPKTGTR